MDQFWEFRPHNDSNNADQATERCLKLCAKYCWCYAAQVTLRDIWPTPYCGLTTDRPTIENEYGTGADYSWGTEVTFDGVSYVTYCGGGGC